MRNGMDHEMLQKRISRGAVEGAPPLSFAQQRLWFLDQLDPGNSAYNVPVLLRVDGPLNIAVLKQSVEEIVRRHEALRTVFRSTDGQPVQEILPPRSLDLAVTDLQALPPGDREARGVHLAGEEAMKPFDLSRGPMIRVNLWQVDAEAFLLLVTMHHISSDGWSIGVLMTELVSLYDAYVAQKPSPLPDLEIQYADYAAWQRLWLQGEVLERQLSYWKRQLAGAPPVLELPPDRPRPAVQNMRGRQQPVVLSRELTEGLKALSRRHNVTLFMTLLAAFETLLHRHSGQSDILLGVPIAGRVRAETQGLIGFFVNTLVMRADFADDPTFAELLRRVRRTSLESFEHQDLPFEKLVEELHPERDPSYNPLVQVMFAFENAPMPAAPSHVLKLHPLRIESGTTKFDLTLTLYDEDGLRGFFEYASDLFDPDTIRRMEGHFQTMLRGIIADQEQRVSMLPLLTESERQTLIVDWNRAGTAAPTTATVQELFEAQVNRTPDADALGFGDRRLTYRQLNRWANQLSHALRAQGVGPEVPVALCMEQSLEMMMAVIGIFKSGGAYVPVDPQNPPERIAFILTDTRPAVILTQRALLDRLPAVPGRVLCIEPDFSFPGPDSGENLPLEVTPDNLAYVIYTSGSTGKPKGVQITHRALAIHSLETVQCYGLCPTDRMLQFFSLSFDASLEQIFPPLICGAMVMVRDVEVWSPAEAYRKVGELGLTVLHMSTAYWHELAQGWSSLPGPSLRLRLVLVGGEAMMRASVDLWQQGPTEGVRLLNAYGPTETTIAATTYEVPARDPKTAAVAARGIPIGKRRGDRSLYILDGHRQPVPIGVAGELYIGGDTVSRGYLNRPELNEQVFLPDHLSGTPGKRLYRTGDRARFLAGGDVEFLGRNDSQIKIRGFRVELGEIESALVSHPSVAESAVLVAGEGGVEKMLVAYIVWKEGAAASTAEVRAYLGDRLPGYMVPSVYVPLKAMPLTSNAKIDRRALPAPDASKVERVTDYIAPRDPLEQQLTNIWQKLFEKRPIGVRDNFFELGGHSLMAVRLFSQVERLTKKTLPLVTLFQAPTIERLAGVLRQQGWEAPFSSLVPIKPGGSRPPFYCVHGVGGNILEFEHFSRYIDPDQPLYGLQAQGLDGKRPRHSSVEKMAEHYIAEIRQFQPEGPYYLGGSSFGGMVAFEMAQQLNAGGQGVGLLVLFDTNAPGYPRYLPTTTSLKRMFDHMRFRVELHWGNIKVARPAIRREYIVAKSKRFVKQYRAKIKHKSRGAVKSLRERILPRAIRQVQKGGHQAQRKYEARPYPGKVTLFRATEQPYGVIPDPANGWGRFCPGGLEILDIPGHHGAIMREPRAQYLVKTLMDCLTKAQSGAHGRAGEHQKGDS